MLISTPEKLFKNTARQTVYLTLTSTCALSDLTEESVVAEINANFAGAASVQSFDGFDNEFVV